MGRVADKVVLIDGETLASLMIDPQRGRIVARLLRGEAGGLRLLQRDLKDSPSLLPSPAA